MFEFSEILMFEFSEILIVVSILHKRLLLLLLLLLLFELDEYISGAIDNSVSSIRDNQKS